MNMLLSRYRYLFAALIFLLAYILLYPFYRYVFDDDAIGYLMVAKRLAAGDGYNAINGCWSPLHSWLVVPFIKAGMDAFFAFKVSNALIGAGILFFMHRLLKRTPLTPQLQTCTLLVAIPVILSFCFYEVAADILVCLLLLIYADIITASNFFEKPYRNLLAGVVCCLAYFAKTYALPFFLVHFITIQLIYYSRSPLTGRKRYLVRNLVLGWGACLLLALPWIWLLYKKYHFLTWGYAGTLNFSWQLTPPAERARMIFIPPVNASSPGGWEDPWSYHTGRIYHSFSSLPIFLKQVKLVFHNCKEAIRYFNQLSFLGVALISGLILYLFKERSTFLTILLITILLIPAGYLLVYIETRYLWAAALLLLIAGAWLLQDVFRRMDLARWQRAFGWTIFFTSFLLYPVDSLQDHLGIDKDIFDMAQAIQHHGIRGKFVALSKQSQLQRAAYLSATQCYIASPAYSDEELLAQARHEHIPYLIYIYDDLQDAGKFRRRSLYTTAARQTAIAADNMIIVEIPVMQ